MTTFACLVILAPVISIALLIKLVLWLVKLQRQINTSFRDVRYAARAVKNMLTFRDEVLQEIRSSLLSRLLENEQAVAQAIEFLRANRSFHHVKTGQPDSSVAAAVISAMPWNMARALVVEDYGTTPRLEFSDRLRLSVQAAHEGVYNAEQVYSAAKRDYHQLIGAYPHKLIVAFMGSKFNEVPDEALENGSASDGGVIRGVPNESSPEDHDAALYKKPVLAAVSKDGFSSP
ncbi:MAG TPA: hypothetical protein VFA07_16020 [Chthonomonadaceae bacterium]|nr:hypothetical protein [Chthonomonadaceae bacterium]